MLTVTEAAVRVSKGLVLWVVSGVTRDHNYWPCCEGLAWEWWKRGHHQWRPCVWWKVDNDDGGTGIPGSGGKQWLRADWEYVLAFKREGALPWADNTVMGHPPVVSQAGGAMSNRLTDGTRTNARGRGSAEDPWGTDGHSGLGGRKKDGKKNSRKKRKVEVDDAPLMEAPGGKHPDGTLKEHAKGRPMPKLANPGNCVVIDPTDPKWIVKARVGGGHMGSELCHRNEAPFPEQLAEFFVRSFVPPGGVVFDGFSGSGTTVAVAVECGRRGIGCDLRQSQVDLGEERVRLVTPKSLFHD